MVGSHRLIVDTPMKAMPGGYSRPTIPDPNITITELRPVLFRGISNNFMLAPLPATTVITVGICKDSNNRLSRTKGTQNIMIPSSALRIDLHLLLMPRRSTPLLSIGTFSHTEKLAQTACVSCTPRRRWLQTFVDKPVLEATLKPGERLTLLPDAIDSRGYCDFFDREDIVVGLTGSLLAEACTAKGLEDMVRQKPSRCLSLSSEC
ncbi:hypothetical protein GGR55DRAFT_482484 [Xylaria sp. FL0064]|nr:hypothetical protein GGR55DRAFT_482484 [Xylaria sp. FL0064]